MEILHYDDFISPADNITVQRHTCQNTQQMMATHAHEFIEIVYCYEGSGVQVVDGHEYAMRRGTLLFLNYGCAHSFYSDTEMHYFNFLLLPSFLSESLINTVDALSLLSLAAFSDFKIPELVPAIQLSGRVMLETEDIAERMSYAFTHKEPGYRAALLGYMTVLFSIIFRHMTLPTEADAARTAPYNSLIITPEIIAYIEAHLNEKLTLAELASRSFCNPAYFSRIFKAYSGQSLSDFIHRKRVDWAMHLLKTTHMSVEQISLTVGYGDKKQLYKQFKQYYDMTPGSLRRP